MQNVKGTYDYFGKERAIRTYVQAELQDVFELYDFNGMDTTILNELELLTSKYAGGDEILKEMYQLTDQGKRSLGLRYDLTLPFAKVIALNPSIELPFKRYEMGKVFRDGPVKRGRLREFIQCDVDVVGVEGPEAEAELMQLATEVFRRLDIPIVLRWNNRRFLGEVLEAIGISSDKKLTVMLTLDKKEKIGKDEIENELAGKELDSRTISSLMELIEMDNPTFEQISSKCGVQRSPGSMEVIALQKLIQELGLGQTCKFDPFLSRGLSFYTGTVYEIFDATNSFTSSLGGGGRYDAIIGQLIGKEDMQYPTVGLSFGMESLMELISSRDNLQLQSPSVVVLPIGDTISEALKVAAELRNAGIRTRVDTTKRKLKKSLASASAKGIAYVILIGESEAQAGKLRLKDMNEMSETVVEVEEALYLLQNRMTIWT
ncbi:histidyl-tRNA synthetase [Paenibacillus taihuensis]|uniref:Histidine--tRNA ligase n=1 Tax=Paenibacillus taihuensis TaxID=1156355 RepID=A0A3D9R140_9BACL|nr:histidine--tRNA ligase [Paenibacillus taihuensis]REE67582.1 histidyl-tRNA synthetase [Paenibacillus taihuensis]